ncbi:hypothetical protein BOX15_Mlig013480g2 [Macrostomum lignano]|uniref:IRS-type PTB domain-containing protein n=2 Tax=Macrostomum lignano TaxID=282301 RepID=A0A267EJ36_9PLAT|nr:hypothetical protein BOX15_Mlig013480g2 [Macrostomum lignano]
MNFHIFHVKSKIFKKPPKNDWFEVRVEVDSVNKKLLFTVPRESNELYEEYYETGEPSKEAEAVQQPVIEPQSIDLSEFRPPKIKGDGKETTKKGEAFYRLELPGRSRLSGKSLKISCQDRSMFQEFCRQLKPHFNLGPDSAHNSSVLSLAQLGRHHSSDSSRQQKPLQPQSEVLELDGGGEYATVMGDGNSAAAERQMEMIVVTSSIYEAFELERCFQVTFDSIRSDSDLPQSLRQLRSGDPLHLYVGVSKLELLNREKCPLCDWPLTQIRSFKHNDQQVQLDVGTRTITGRSLLSFKFDSLGPSAAARFAQVLANHLALPPECPCCHGSEGRGRRGLSGHQLGRDQLAESDDDKDSSEVTDKDEQEDNGAASSDGLRSNPCYHEEEVESLNSKPAKTKDKVSKVKTSREQRQQRKRMLRQTRMKSAEPDYYSSVVRKPQSASVKLSQVSPPPPPAALAAAASFAESNSPSVEQQQQPRPNSLVPPNRQTSVETISVTPPAPPPPPRTMDDAYESVVAIPPAEFADDVKIAMQFSDAYVQEQQKRVMAQKTQKKKAKK